MFKLDWASYSSLRFADTFLPYVAGYKAKGSYIFDGAELFKDSRKVDRKLLPLTKSDKLVTLLPIHTLKDSSKKNRISNIQPHDLSLELDEYGDIDMSFKFGRDFKSYLRSVSKADSPQLQVKAQLFNH